MTEPIPLDESSAVLTRSEFTLTYAVTGPNVPMPYGSTDIVPETVMLAIRETEDGDLEVWRMAGDLQEVLADDKPVVCIRHRTHVPCRHGSPEDPCLETDDPRAVALTAHYQRAVGG